MAISFVQSAKYQTNTTAASSGVVTLGSTPTPGNYLLFGFTFWDGPGGNLPTGVTQLQAPHDATGEVTLKAGYRVVQSGDSASWTFPFLDTDYFSAVVMEFSGVSAIGNNGSSNSNATSHTQASVTGVSGDMAVLFFGRNTGTITTPSGTWTQDQDAAADFNKMRAYHKTAVVGANSPAWTGMTSAGNVSALIMLNAAAGGTTVTPSTASLTLTRFAPTVTTTNNVTVTPTTKALTLTTFAPTVTASDHKTVTPSTASLTLTTFAPTVTIGNNQTVTPATAALTITTYAPTVTASDNKLVTPSPASLTLTTYAPTVTASDNKTVTPGTASLTLTSYAPTVAVSGSVTVTPGTASLSLTTYAPVVTASVSAEAPVVTGALAFTSPTSGTKAFVSSAAPMVEFASPTAGTLALVSPAAGSLDFVSPDTSELRFTNPDD